MEGPSANVAYYLRKKSRGVETLASKVVAKKSEEERTKLASLDLNKRTVTADQLPAKKPSVTITNHSKIPRSTIPQANKNKLSQRDAKKENKKQIRKKAEGATTSTTHLTTTASTSITAATTTTTTRGTRVTRSTSTRIVKSHSEPDLIVDVKRHDRARLPTITDSESLSPDCISYLTSEIPDPDLKDKDDPQLCTEYIRDIYQYLLNAERDDMFKLQHDLLSRQKDIDGSHRRTLLDWLVQVHLKFKLLPDTLHVCIDILDRYLQKVTVSKKHLQLVGITALFIASKYEEIYSFSIAEFAYITADTYTTNEIRKKEVEILTALNYQLGKPNPLTFLRRYSKLMSTTTQIHNLAKYFIEILYFSTESSSLLPSQRAIGSLVLATRVMSSKRKDEEIWGASMEQHTWYSQERASVFMDKVLQGVCGYYRHSLSSSRENGSGRHTAVKDKYCHGYQSVAALPRLQERLEGLEKSCCL